jgi:16S rRNA (cytosine967-C5)-methyltransferase
MSARQIAFLALKNIYQNNAYTDIALDQVLRKYELKSVDRGLVSELVYGIVRRQKTLDTLINQFAPKKAHKQPPNLRIILHLGLYQLRYLDTIPDSAAVNTSVELAKQNGLQKLAGVVNGILREYIRQSTSDVLNSPTSITQEEIPSEKLANLRVKQDPLILPPNQVQRLGILSSFPDWIIEIFKTQIGLDETEKLCEWFNQSAPIDLRINPLKTTRQEVKTILNSQGIKVKTISHLPQGLRLINSVGNIQYLPGFAEGWFSVQDASAQLVSHLLDPQPGELIVDACAAPGGKTTHLAELMGDRGTVIGCDRHEKRLAKLTENAARLGLKSINIEVGDSSSLTEFQGKADRVLVDAPCSGLGTLHKRPDIRWQQNPHKVKNLSQLQQEILRNAATWVKSGGNLVYATCTLNPPENEQIINQFLRSNPQWKIEQQLPENNPAYFYWLSQGMIKIWPHIHQMDGFFMVKLIKK